MKDFQAIQKPPALKREHPALQTTFLWIIFAYLDRIQPTKINVDPCGSNNIEAFARVWIPQLYRVLILTIENSILTAYMFLLIRTQARHRNGLFKKRKNL
jgi:hypothetical protein